MGLYQYLWHTTKCPYHQSPITNHQSPINHLADSKACTHRPQNKSKEINPKTRDDVGRDTVMRGSIYLTTTPAPSPPHSPLPEPGMPSPTPRARRRKNLQAEHVCPVSSPSASCRMMAHCSAEKRHVVSVREAHTTCGGVTIYVCCIGQTLNPKP